MAGFRRRVFMLSLILGLAVCLYGQQPGAEQAAPFPPPPPTKLEAFQPAPGSVFTVGHEDLGNVNGVNVDVREMRDTRGKPVRGVIVEITGERTERSYVDADELAGLLRGSDALLEVTSNPTAFKIYEARLMTRGGLELAASANVDRGLTYEVTVGRFRVVTRSLSAAQMRQLRDMFAAAGEKLAALPD